MRSSSSSAFTSCISGVHYLGEIFVTTSMGKWLHPTPALEARDSTHRQVMLVSKKISAQVATMPDGWGNRVRLKLHGYTRCKRTCYVEQAVSCI